MFGQCHGKGCSLMQLTFGLNRATVEACNPLHDGQAPPGTAAVTGGICTEETFKNMGQVFGTDTDTVIPDGQHNGIIGLCGVSPHIIAGLGE